METAPQPAMESERVCAGHQFGVTDALSYLNPIKIRFHDRLDRYNLLMDTMKDLKSQE